jgi:hypothetical protein
MEAVSQEKRASSCDLVLPDAAMCHDRRRERFQASGIPMTSDTIVEPLPNS